MEKRTRKGKEINICGVILLQESKKDILKDILNRYNFKRSKNKQKEVIHAQ